MRDTGTMRRGSAANGSVGSGVLRSAALLTLLTLSATACGPVGRDIYDAFNTRDTGPYTQIGRALSSDGALVIHVLAQQPAHAEQIAQQIVRQNYAASPPSVRVIVDPAASGPRQVFRWDGRGVRIDTSTEGLPPAPEPAQHGGPAAH